MKKYYEAKRKISEQELLDHYDRLATKWARKMEKRLRAKRWRQVLSTQHQP